MNKAIHFLKQEFRYMNNDIDFVKTMSVYGYVIFSSIAMLIGLTIGMRG